MPEDERTVRMNHLRRREQQRRGQLDEVVPEGHGLVGGGGRRHWRYLYATCYH